MCGATRHVRFGPIAGIYKRPIAPAPGTGAGVLEATSEEIKSGFEGYFSYCGSYDVDVPKGFIIHHLELSAFPNWVGTDQKRYFEFSGDRLTLKTPPLTLSGRDQVHRLIWERLSWFLPRAMRDCL